MMGKCHVIGRRDDVDSLKDSLSFYSDWIEWNMDDSTQKNVSIEWNQIDGEQSDITYFIAQFCPDRAFVSSLEEGDLLTIIYDEADINITGVVQTLTLLQTSSTISNNKNDAEFKSSQENVRVQIKFRVKHKDDLEENECHLLKGIKFLIDSVVDVTIKNVGLYNNYLKQERNIRTGLRRMAKDRFLCRILADYEDHSIVAGDEEENNNLKKNFLLPNLDRDNALRHQVTVDNLNCKSFSLNESQMAMIEHAINNRITLVMGPPGTGKTYTSAVLACNLYETRTRGNNSKILVCASSNVAVDNLAMAIHKLNKLKVVRIRSHRNERRQDSQPYHMDKLIEQAEGHPFDEYRKMVKKEKALLGQFFYLDKLNTISRLEADCEKAILKEADVICCTCSGSSKLIRIPTVNIDSLIIDECSQVCIPEGLLPVRSSPRRIILVGDDNQLGPVIKDRYATKYCDDNIVLYSKLKKIGFKPKLLDMQYRMHPELVKFANREFYESLIKNGVGNNERCWNDWRHLSPFPNLSAPIYFLCHKYNENRDHNSTSRHNIGEIDLVLNSIITLLSRGVQSKAIGVITPYIDQCKLICDKLKNLRKKSKSKHSISINNRWIDRKLLASCANVEVATVDAYQGREKDYIIVSLVRSLSRLCESCAFIADRRRLNVTLTRAKYGMIIIGNPTGMDREPLLNKFIKDLSDRHLLYDQPLSESSKPMELNQFEAKYFRFKEPPQKIEIISLD